MIVQNDLRGPEGPLFHGCATFHEFFRTFWNSCPSLSLHSPSFSAAC
jgi:hypothetical protein